MAQESRLAVTIDSRGAKRNADDLTGSLQDMTRAGDAAAASADGVSSSLDDQRKELSQLLGQINPTVAALGRLDDMQEKLAKLKKAGIVESDTFVEYTDRINVMRDALGESSATMNKAGMSAKAYQAALRGVPAQFTDIAVSLQGGQAPLTVLLQQGGQLKDMFGGIGPAAQALGGYILGLVNPFTVAAAAAGALALAYYKGSEQTDALRNSLILTGNFSKASEAQLIALADSADQVTGTFGQAAGALAQLTSAGANTSGNLKLITTTAVEMQRVTGKAVEDTVAEFIKLGKDPVAGIVELDEKYRFLTASVYAQIKALSDQGNAVAAADLAERTYAEAMGQRTSKIRENLGLIERGWLNIKDATNEVLDAFASIGRRSVESEGKAITQLQQKIAYLQSTLDTAYEDNDARDRIASLQAELKQRQDIQKTNAATIEEEEKRRRIQEEGRKGLQDLDSSYKSALTQTQRLNKELTDLDKAREKAVAAGVFTAAEEAKYAQSRKNIEKEIADIKEREAKKSTPRGANKSVSEAETTFARLYNQYDPAAQAARTLTKEQGQLDLALSKGKISQEEYGKALAQASINYAAAIKGAQGLTQAEQYRAQLERQLAGQQSEYSIAAAGVGMGDQQTQRLQQRVQLEQQTNDRILQLRTELANATTEKQRQDLQAQIDLTNEFLPKQLAAQQAGWAQMDQAMLNPINGWTAALQNFQVTATNVAGQAQSLFTGAFSNITTGVGSAFEKMTLDGQTFGESVTTITRSLVGGVINGLGQMAAQWLINQGIQVAFGQTSAALAAQQIAQVGAVTAAETTGAAAVATAKVAADGVATASSLAATATTTAAQTAAAATTASAWLPAALVASIGSFGAAAVVGGTALLAAFALIKGFSTGGYVSGSGTGTSDSIPARLSNGEFVVNAKATSRNRELLEAINSNERVTFSGENLSVNASNRTETAQAQKSGMSLTVNLIEDKANAGKVSQSTSEDGQNIVQIVVASIMGDGPVYDAVSSKFSLQGVGS
ncbi:phage tail length tape measure family protein [Pseudomonas sp. M2]|uniref:phage tail length tape measure family protein n=1 Tax=Pseudomonas sp. M2 TaxID=228756 RepID=UPI0018CB4CF6|nr:phage tail length tape measure family protein [Pseudomonas sp. M2]MBG6123269.1 phage-related minor tail protein [Pseudomonas sp. M2]HDS1744198.1 phage tail length tape measure family protein [Pseudomonas putida]